MWLHGWRNARRVVVAPPLAACLGPTALLLDDRRFVPLRVTACIGERDAVMNLNPTTPMGRRGYRTRRAADGGEAVETREGERRLSETLVGWGRAEV